MKKPVTINVTQPCGQSWEEMQPSTTGRFCGACQKHVVDFTAFSDEQFIAYFQAYPQSPDLCGRFKEKQLSITIPPKPAPITFWNVNKIAAASLIAALGFTYKADAQIKDTLYSQSIFESKPDNIFFEKLIVLKGIVQDETGFGIPGASLAIKGTTNTTLTDMNGRFELELPEQDAAYVLTCQSFDMITQELTIRVPCDITITMETNPELEMLGGYQVNKPSLWQWLTRPFRRK